VRVGELLERDLQLITPQFMNSAHPLGMRLWTKARAASITVRFSGVGEAT
jgi:hypothetical protein